MGLCQARIFPFLRSANGGRQIDLSYFESPLIIGYITLLLYLQEISDYGLYGERGRILGESSALADKEQEVIAIDGLRSLGG